MRYRTVGRTGWKVSEAIRSIRNAKIRPLVHERW
jgi:hypothetical protein